MECSVCSHQQVMRNKSLHSHSRFMHKFSRFYKWLIVMFHCWFLHLVFVYEIFQVTFQTPARTPKAVKSFSPSAWSALRELDDHERWVERTSVVTKQDHDDYAILAREFLDEIVDAAVWWVLEPGLSCRLEGGGGRSYRQGPLWWMFDGEGGWHICGGKN